MKAIGGKKFFKHFLRNLLLAFILTSCDNDQQTLCYRYVSIPVEGWEIQNSISFPIDTIKTESDYAITLGLRTTNRYPFQSIWLLVKQRWYNPDTTFMDTVKCVLMDNFGNESGSGISFKQNEYSIKNVHLKSKQSGSINISHIMRRNILEGISDVGIKLEKR